MKFPKHLDQEDMDLAMKEWRLAGYAVHRGPVKDSVKKDVITMVVVGEERKGSKHRRMEWQLMSYWMWFVGYEESARGGWRKSLERGDGVS